eukprot:4830329-Lingulodinium_polyedra.AAC.1
MATRALRIGSLEQIAFALLAVGIAFWTVAVVGPGAASLSRRRRLGDKPQYACRTARGRKWPRSLEVSARA